MTPRTTITILLAISACRTDGRPPDTELATAIGVALAQACPLGADPSDQHARDACADELAGLAVLRDAMTEPFLWGGQPSVGKYAIDKGTTRFNARVWRRLYAATFMFDACFSVEQVDAQTILHVPVQFRGAMPTGAYPYPFWHSQKKWDAYSYATTIHFVIENGRVIGALRGASQDTTRQKTPHAWDGQWGTPRVSLYAYLLSETNPFATRLDDSYRALEHGYMFGESPRKSDRTTIHFSRDRKTGKSSLVAARVMQVSAPTGSWLATAMDKLAAPRRKPKRPTTTRPTQED